MRVALFGGTFDPPHHGHIAVAKAAADAFQLDEVLFAPTGKQPLKLDVAATPFADRLGLVTAACMSDSRFFVSEIDAPRSNGVPNYTIDTLEALRKARPEDTLFNLVGADSFLTLRQWKEPERLLELVEWIVATRPGYPPNFDSLGLNSVQLPRVHLLRDVDEDISATELRQRLHRRDECSDLLPIAVSAYIKEHGLYSS